MQDLIANMLTAIHNAQAVRIESIKIPHSKITFRIAEILKQEGWVKNAEIKKRGEKSWIIVELRYRDDGAPFIQDAKRVSKLGKRIYRKAAKIPFERHGEGVIILSTSKGVMTSKEAKKEGVGGELLCEVY